MTRFGKRAFASLVVGSLLSGCGLLALRVSHMEGTRTEASAAQLKAAEEALAKLDTQMVRWQALALTGGTGALLMEPVSLSADFKASELPAMNRVLAGMYANRGFLNLKRFVFELQESAQDSAGKDGERSGRITLTGEKVFLQ